MRVTQINQISKIKIFILVYCFIILQSACLSRNDLQETRDKLQDHIDETENIIDITSLEVKPSSLSPKEAFDENNQYNFTSDYIKYLTVDEFVSFIQKNEQIDAEIIKPNNLVKLSVDVMDLNNLLGLEIGDNAIIANAPLFIPSTIHFWDGTTLAVNGNYKTLDTTKIKERNGQDANGFKYNEFLIPVDKPIRAVDFDVKFKHKGFTGYRLDSVNKIAEADGGRIEWLSNQNGEVKISYPQAMDKRIGETCGFYKNGEMLKNSGRTSYSIPSIEMIEWLKKTLPTYQKAVDLIDNKELKKKQEVDGYLAKNLSKKPAQSDKKTFAKTFYAGPVNHIMIYVENSKPESVTKKVSMKLHKDDRENFNEGYFVAIDSKNNKYGIIDAKGTWVINPTYEDIKAESKGTFSVYENRIGTVRKLDVQNKKFVDLSR